MVFGSKRTIFISLGVLALLFIGGFILRVVYESNELEKGSVEINGVVEKIVRHHREESYQRSGRRMVRRPASTSYDVYYYYVVDGDTVRDKTTTMRPKLRKAPAGTKIPITYAISDYHIHRAHTDRMTVRGRYVFAK